MLDTISIVVTMAVGVVVAGIVTLVATNGDGKDMPPGWAYILLFVSEGLLMLSLLINISADLVRWLGVAAAIFLIVWGMWKGLKGLVRTSSYAHQQRRIRY